MRQLIAKFLIATLPGLLSPERVYRVITSASSLLLRGKEKRLRADVARMFPDKPQSWVEAMVTEQRIHRAWNAIDKTMLTRMSPEELIRRTDADSIAAARAVCDEAIAEGNGGIVFSMHYGRPLVAPYVLSHLGYPYVTIRSGASQSDLDTEAVKHAGTIGIEVIEASELSSGVQAMRALKRNKLFFVLVDGRATDRATTVKFLGADFPVAIGFAQLAKRTGAALIAGITYSDGPLQFRMSPTRVRLPEGDLTAEEMAALLMRPLEEAVAREIGQWYGINRVFRLGRRRNR